MGEFGKYKAAIARNNHSMEVQELQSKIEQLEKRVKEGLEKIDQFEKEGCLFPEWLYWAKKALRGECE